MNGRRRMEQGARWMAGAAVTGLLWLAWRPEVVPSSAVPDRWPSLPDDSAAAWARLRAVAMHPVPDPSAPSEGGRSALAQDAPPRLRLERMPPPSVRVGLGALARRRGPVTWEDGTGARGLAAVVQPVAGAATAWRLQVAAPPGAPLVTSDAGGMLDSLVTPGTGVTGWQLATVQGDLTVRLSTARLTVSPPRAVGSQAAPVVRLVASPGWEAKFVTAALEEAGWRVEGTLPVAPTAAVRLGTPGALAPRTVAAVVVLDSTPTEAAAIMRFVRAGGGLVLAGEAAASPRWRPLAPAQVGALEAGLAGALTGDHPRLGVAAHALRPMADAVLVAADTLAPGSVRPLVVARRTGSGRVAVSALHETWRWRMQGRDDGAEAHRRWWVDLVSTVAGTAALATMGVPSDNRLWPGDLAPYADLVARLGAPVAGAPSRPDAARVGTMPAPRPSTGWRIPLFLLALTALLVEWTSRRLRGAR